MHQVNKENESHFTSNCSQYFYHRQTDAFSIDIEIFTSNSSAFLYHEICVWHDKISKKKKCRTNDISHFREWKINLSAQIGTYSLYTFSKWIFLFWFNHIPKPYRRRIILILLLLLFGFIVGAWWTKWIGLPSMIITGKPNAKSLFFRSLLASYLSDWF